MNKVLTFFEDLGVGGLWCLTAVQPEQVLRIANLVLAILTTLFVFVTRIVEWWKKAKKDGKITKDEIEELGSIVGEGIKDIKENVESAQDSKKGEN